MKKTSPKQDIAHESGWLHVTGAAKYIDDIAVSDQLLFGRIVYSKVSCGRIVKLDLSKAVKLEGVYCILTAKDIIGVNNMGPVVKDEPVLAEESVTFIGQAICLIGAKDEQPQKKRKN